jgi:hypothetical protein
MHIIFDKDRTDALAKLLATKYTVLELDTIQFSNSNATITAYSVIENVPLLDMVKIPEIQSQHNALLISYRARDWPTCYLAINNLLGKWGGELDSFYNEMKKRIDLLSSQELDDNWNGNIIK